MKVRDLIKLIKQDGWRHVRTSGSHKHFHHPTKPEWLRFLDNWARMFQKAPETV